MKFLHKALAYPPFRRVWRESFDSLQDLLLNDVVLRQDFTTLGAARLMQDIAAIQSVVDSCVYSRNGAIGAGSALSMPKLKEAATLLNLPLEIDGESRMSLKEMYKEVFATNQQATEALEKLGMTHLSNNDARMVLPRRVEASDD